MTAVRVAGPESSEPPANLLQTGDVEQGPSWLDTRLRRGGRPLGALRAVPHIGTYAGIAVTVLGGVLLLVAWVKTAALTNVGLQMPYLISAGCTGVALVVVGLTVVNVAAKAEDARRRQAQLAELHEILAELRRAVESGR